MTKAITFHFYNTGTRVVTSAVTGIEEDLLWFERNFAVTEKLTPNNQGFAMMTNTLQKQIKKTDLLYKYLPSSGTTFFIKDGDNISKLGEL